MVTYMKLVKTWAKISCTFTQMVQIRRGNYTRVTLNELMNEKWQVWGVVYTGLRQRWHAWKSQHQGWMIWPNSTIRRLSHHTRFVPHYTAHTRWTSYPPPLPLSLVGLWNYPYLSWFHCASTAGQTHPLLLEKWLSFVVDFFRVNPLPSSLVVTSTQLNCSLTCQAP